MLPLIINPVAEADIAEAKAWYEGRVPGLGDDFVRRVEDTFSRLQHHPSMYAKVFQEARLALVCRFPCSVVYRIDEFQITILAVYHTSRDPRGWQQRT